MSVDGGPPDFRLSGADDDDDQGQVLQMSLVGGNKQDRPGQRMGEFIDVHIYEVENLIFYLI